MENIIFRRFLLFLLQLSSDTLMLLPKGMLQLKPLGGLSKKEKASTKVYEDDPKLYRIINSFKKMETVDDRKKRLQVKANFSRS